MDKAKNQNWLGPAEEVLGILRCLSCGNNLRQAADGLVCAVCGRKYPVLNGIVRFVDTQHYAGSFGFQWKVYAQTQLDGEHSRRSENAFRRRTGFCPEDVAGKLVLDGLCRAQQIRADGFFHGREFRPRKVVSPRFYRIVQYR